MDRLIMNNKKTTPSLVRMFLVLSFFVVGAIAVAEKPDQYNNPLPIKEVQRFAAAVSQIKNYYVKPVTDQELFDNAISGMMSGLDPHSNYLNSQEYENLNTATKGEFSGIGLEVTLDDGFIKVISAVDDSPAAKSGIKPNDIIVSLDTTPIKGLSLREAVSKMRGARGSHVHLLVLRKGQDKPLKFDIIRDVVLVKSIKFKLFSDNLGYIRIANFQSPTASDMNKAIYNLLEQAGGELKGLILDLRNNPGGLLDAAVQISDSFVDSTLLGTNKLIIYTKGRAQGANYNAYAHPGDILNGAPIVILINEGTASAAEIVAGALQDHKRAIIVGQKSFGKGSVQTIMPLDEKTAIKLTTALYFTPAGRSIQAEGIKPDILIKDVDLSHSKAKEDEYEGFKEANLTKHLANANEASFKKDKANPGTHQNEANLAYEDYQLYEALNLLKGISTIRPAKAL
jgi:carboxyl-terminal processing protease